MIGKVHGRTIFAGGAERPLRTATPRVAEAPRTLPLPAAKKSQLGGVVAFRAGLQTKPAAVDPDRTRLSISELVGRIGPSARVFAQLAEVKEPITLSELYRRVARAVFPDGAGPAKSYLALEKALAAKGLQAEFDRMVGELSPSARQTFFEGQLSPLDVFSNQAKRRADWRESPAPIRYSDLVAALAAEGRSSELAAVEARMSHEDRRGLRQGRSSPRVYDAKAKEVARHDVDVVIIGGGMAGLAAAQELQRFGLRAVVLEAKHRPGGRGFTDPKSFSQPWDVGGAWIHSGAVNPLTKIARDRGFTLVPDKAQLFAFDETGNPAEAGVLLKKEMRAISETWETIGSKGIDQPASRFMPAPTKWTEVAANVLGALEIGAEPDEISTKDYNNIMPERGDFLVQEGLGRLVESFAHGVDVELSRPVSSVKWGEDGVEVRAGGETYRGKRVLITASTGVLMSGNIAFHPPLPEWKKLSIEKLPMGNYDKIALEFAENVFGDLPPAARARRLESPEQPIDFLVRPFAGNMAIAFIGGAHGKALRAKGAKETIEFAVGELEKLFGPDVRGKLLTARTTDWAADPFTQGSYSHALPGFQYMRAELKMPIDDWLFFAGEATSEKWAEHMTGAYLTGREAAERIASSSLAAARVA